MRSFEYANRAWIGESSAGRSTQQSPPEVLPDPPLQPTRPGEPPVIDTPAPPDPQEPWNDPQPPEPPTPRPPELPPEPSPPGVSASTARTLATAHGRGLELGARGAPIVVGVLLRAW